MPTEAELLVYAKDELSKDPRKFFCIDCGRTRKNDWCPWNNKHPTEVKHVTLDRRSISTDLQAHYFIKNKEARATRHVFRD